MGAWYIWWIFEFRIKKYIFFKTKQKYNINQNKKQIHKQEKPNKEERNTLEKNGPW
jgi:hypothetical protein